MDWSLIVLLSCDVLIIIDELIHFQILLVILMSLAVCVVSMEIRSNKDAAGQYYYSSNSGPTYPGSWYYPAAYGAIGFNRFPISPYAGSQRNWFFLDMLSLIHI